jgi:hypothetical protein
LNSVKIRGMEMMMETNLEKKEKTDLKSRRCISW